jgi:hypothetical protein
MEKVIPNNWKQNGVKSKQEQLYTHLTSRKISKRQRKSLHIDKKNNPSRRCYNCKHIITKCQHTQSHKINATGHKYIEQKIAIASDSNTALSNR